MALPYLPHQEIPASFQWLKLQATTPLLHELVDYVKNQWINSNTFLPSSWSVYTQPVCTNNDIEGWYNSLNQRAGGRVHLPFYLLIHLLHRESSVCIVQLWLVNARKLQRIQRKRYHALQAWIFGYWEDYAGSKLSSKRFFKACSHLAYGPVVVAGLVLWWEHLPSTNVARGSISTLRVKCGLSLLVHYSAMRGFAPGTPVFPSHHKPTFDLIWSDL